MQQSLAFINQGAALAGVDEAGRGPLAGPVVAAAVILDADHPIKGLKDSKLLSESRRASFAILIRKNAKAFAVALAKPSEIDDINILQATLLAMERAVAQLQLKPDIIKVDGNQVPKFKDKNHHFVVESVVHGDKLVPAISAASILDRYLAINSVKQSEFQLASLVCLFVAAKHCEGNQPKMVSRFICSVV